jgi:23S rRNA (uracil1939-C5)-methyltransferase
LENKQCPLYRKCGGCQLQNMDYARQLEWKQNRTRKLLGKFGKIEPILGMKNPYYYRNKVQAAFAQDRRGNIVSGVYQSSTHRVVPVKSCLTEDQTADKIMATVRQLLKSFKLHPYDERTERGFLRHVLVKRGFQSGQVMVVLVVSNSIFPAKKFTAALCQKHPEITTVLLNINRHHTSMVLGEQEKVLYGPGYIEDTLCGCRFRISAKSFYQINPVQCEVLYSKAMEYAQLTGKESVIDAYCGIGTIGMVAAKKAGQVLGIELNRDAVRDAAANARQNGLHNIHFVCADATDYLTEMTEEGIRPDVVFMDPPRAGSTERFLLSLSELAPQRVVYISCNPETQARDLQYLCELGYAVQKIQPVDMFPHTNHVETVVLMSRVEGK